MDDIIVWSKDVNQHDERLRGVLERAKRYQLRLSLKNGKIRQSQVSYVGHLLTVECVKADPEKVQAVSEMERLENVKGIRHFLGFIQYLNKFLPRLSEERAPLRELVQKENPWHWDTSQEDSFQKLKEHALSTSVLQYTMT